MGEVLLQLLVLDGTAARLDHGHTLGIEVHRHDLVVLREDHGVREADVSRPNHDDLHEGESRAPR